jgi:hypothetical protein
MRRPAWDPRPDYRATCGCDQRQWPGRVGPSLYLLQTGAPALQSGFKASLLTWSNHLDHEPVGGFGGFDAAGLRNGAMKPGTRDRPSGNHGVAEEAGEAVGSSGGSSSGSGTNTGIGALPDRPSWTEGGPEGERGTPVAGPDAARVDEGGARDAASDVTAGDGGPAADARAGAAATLLVATIRIRSKMDALGETECRVAVT